MPSTLNVKNAAETKEAIPDTATIGNADIFQLLSRMSSETGSWSEVTKAMAIPGIGCVIHTWTQQSGNVSEAMILVPGTRLENDFDGGLKVVKL